MYSYYSVHKKSDFVKNGYIQCEIHKGDASNPEFHMHSYFEMEYIVSGEGECVIDGKAYPVFPGMVFFMCPINVQSMNIKNMNLINISFSENVCDSSLLSFFNFENSAFVTELSKNKRSFMEATSAELIENYDDKNYSALLLNSIVTMLAKISSGIAKNESSASALKQAILYIISNYKRDLSLSDAAKHAGLAPVYFSAQLKKETGMPFKEYVDSLRFSQAQHLLKYSDMTMKQICSESGFTNYANFTRRFKKLFGVSPTKYIAKK